MGGLPHLLDIYIHYMAVGTLLNVQLRSKFIKSNIVLNKRIMYFREIKFGAFQTQISNYFIFFFGLTFYTSWLYEISALGTNSWDNFSHAKNIIILCFMLLMSVAIK